MSGSPRHLVAEELAETCRFGGLSDSYGIMVNRSTINRKSCWVVTFCKAKVLDGEIRVYSPRFIMIKWATQYRNLPAQGQDVFKSVEAAKMFLQKNFIIP